MADPDERVSLAPLQPEEALKALLKVDPESAPAEADEDEDDAAPPPDETP
jgi:hypothetical protein